MICVTFYFRMQTFCLQNIMGANFWFPTSSDKLPTIIEVTSIRFLFMSCEGLLNERVMTLAILTTTKE